VNIVWFIGAMALVLVVYDSWHIVGPGWLAPYFISALVWLCATVLVGLWVRGGSRSASLLLATSLVMALNVPATLVPALRLYNALADSGEEAQHEAVVVSKERRSRSKTKVHKAVLDLGPDYGTIKTSMQARHYSRLPEPGAKVAIRIKPGALGWPWVQSINGYEP
jgi:hypothetical protein